MMDFIRNILLLVFFGVGALGFGAFMLYLLTRE